MNSGEYRLHEVSASDVAALQKISRETFSETFSADNSEENMAKYMEQQLSLDQLTKELNDPNSIFYFAKHQNDVIGYLKLNFGASQTELQEANAVELERIYVLAAYHGRKIGQLLYDKAISIARERKATYLWLGVWEYNQRAINFYTKNGFVAFDKHIFTLGSDEQTDIMMKMPLTD